MWRSVFLCVTCVQIAAGAAKYLTQLYFFPGVASKASHPQNVREKNDDRQTWEKILVQSHRGIFGDTFLVVVWSSSLLMHEKRFLCGDTGMMVRLGSYTPIAMIWGDSRGG